MTNETCSSPQHSAPLPEAFSRSIALVGEDGIRRLQQSTVMLFGCGGVGSWCAEALIRAGLGKLILVDPDRVVLSNINRQLPATYSQLGRLKVEVLAERLRDLQPQAHIETLPLFYDAENAQDFPFEQVNYVVDAIDSVPSKIHLIRHCYELKRPIISALGAGNKQHASLLRLGQLGQTSVCPLARILRRAFRGEGLDKHPVVWSPEVPARPVDTKGKRLPFPASISWVPPVAGFLLAEHVALSLMQLPPSRSGQ